MSNKKIVNSLKVVLIIIKQIKKALFKTNSNKIIKSNILPAIKRKLLVLNIKLKKDDYQALIMIKNIFKLNIKFELIE